MARSLGVLCGQLVVVGIDGPARSSDEAKLLRAAEGVGVLALTRSIRAAERGETRCEETYERVMTMRQKLRPGAAADEAALTAVFATSNAIAKELAS